MYMLSVHNNSPFVHAGLSRCQLVLLGYLLGCDYTAGLEGVGIVSAMELIRDFPGDGLEPLEKIRYVRTVHGRVWCVVQCCCRDWHGDALVKPAMVKQASGVLKKLVSAVKGVSM